MLSSYKNDVRNEIAVLVACPEKQQRQHRERFVERIWNTAFIERFRDYPVASADRCHIKAI